jgi:hypothetical protein
MVKTRAYTNDLINQIIEGYFPIENLYVTSKENLKYQFGLLGGLIKL